MRKIIALLLFTLALATGSSHAATNVRIGVYQDYPLVFVDSNKEAKGAYIDVLEYIAEEEEWSVEYVYCKWADCLVQLEQGSIDILTAIAYSEERTKQYDFNEETFFPNWGQVYTKSNVAINSIADLSGKAVSGVKDDIYYSSLQQVATKADLDIVYVDVDEYEKVFQLLEKGEVDAGILPRLFGDMNEGRFNVKKTTTVIRPSELRFASPKGLKKDILAVVDKHLVKLKADKDSLYFKSITKWLGQQQVQIHPEVKLTDAEKKWLMEHKHIVLGADPEFVPFEFIEADGSYRGICADYVRIISERTGIFMNVASDLDWNEVIERSKERKVDVLPCVGMTEERKKYLTYSTPHQSFYRVVVTQKDSEIGNAPDDLRGFKVAVQRNSSHHGFIKDNTVINPLLFETAEQAIIAVSEGKADVFIGNENMSGYTINKNSITNLKRTKMAGSMAKNLYFAVRSDWPELLSIINKGLDSISEKEREAIKQKWIAVKIEKRVDYAFMFKILGAVFCFLVLLGLWNANIGRQRRKLQESEEKYRTLVEGLHEGYFFYTHDLQGVFTYISPSVTHFLGYSPDELLIDFSKILTDNPVNLEMERFTGLCMQGKPQPSYLVEVFHKDKSRRWLEVSEVPIFDKRGRVVSVEGIAHNITERLQAEEKLRESEKRYRSLAEYSMVGILQVTPEGAPIYINPVLLDIIDADEPSQVGGKTILDFVTPEHQEALAQQMEKRHRNIASTYEVEIISLKGIRRNVMISAAPIMSEDGHLDSTISSVVDISDLKNAQKELNEAKDKAEKANMAKSSFLANMSHELRTPLNAILGFSELMTRDSNLSQEQLKNLETIGASGEHLLALINDVLELSKIEAGQIVLQPENFDLYYLLSLIEDMFKLRARHKGLTLVVERSTHVPRFIRTDQGKLRQSLINILGNAVKFTEQGSVALRVNCKDQRLYFEIEDTGTGIAPEDLERVFDTFVQSASSNGSQQGTGLGIPISQRFVELMGGTLTAESELGKGSIFRFDVGGEKVDHVFEDSVPEQRVAGIAEGKQYRLLVVEDDESSRQLLVTLLREIGFEVRDAINGRDAVDKWKNWQPQLVWMDIQMPEMDGYQATRNIRALPGGEETVIIALTAQAFEEDKAKVLESGCNDFVRKPFRQNEILEMLQKYLGVDYFYEEQGFSADNGLKQMSEAIATLPSELHATFLEAVQLAAFDGTAAVIDKIGELDQDLASGLREMLDKYQFDALEQLFTVK